MASRGACPFPEEHYGKYPHMNGVLAPFLQTLELPIRGTCLALAPRHEKSFYRVNSGRVLRGRL
jgi:hypothetical protein